MLMRRGSLNSLHDVQRQSPVNGSYILSERRREGERKGERKREKAEDSSRKG